MGSSTRRVPRRAVGVATAAAILLAPATWASAGWAQEGEGLAGGNVDANLPYACTVADAAHDTGPAHDTEVHVAATLPEEGEVEEPIQPSDVTVTAILPQPVVDELTEMGAASVTATGRLTVTVTQHGNDSDAAWQDLTAPPAALAEEGGELALPLAGEVPTVTVTSPGEVDFVAAELDMELTPQRAGGSPTGPETIPVECTPDEQESTQLGSVAVPDADGSEPETPPGNDSAPDPAQPGAAPAEPQNVEDAPPGCFDVESEPPEPNDLRLCGYLGGYTNINELDASMRIDSDQTEPEIKLGTSYVFPGNEEILAAVCPFVVECPEGLPDWAGVGSVQSSIHLRNHGTMELPPAEANVLAFDFMPVTATVEMVDVDELDVRTNSYHGDMDENPNAVHNQFDVKSSLAVQVHEVSVNGIALDVGSTCLSERIDVDMGGYATGVLEPQSPEEYLLEEGGVLHGFVDIPAFTDCGAGEDLDPLLTGMVSGPDNYAKMTQSRMCDSGTGAACPPERLEPRH